VGVGSGATGPCASCIFARQGRAVDADTAPPRPAIAGSMFYHASFRRVLLSRGRFVGRAVRKSKAVLILRLLVSDVRAQGERK
jgi:hypothetical protein